MTAPTLAQFRAALLARLGTMKKSAGNPTGKLRRVDLYQDDLVDWVKNRGFDGPQCLVHIAGVPMRRLTTHSYRKEVDVQLFIGVSNYRGKGQAISGGSSSEPGSHELLEDIETLLVNHDLDLDGVGGNPLMEPLSPEGWFSIVEPENAASLPFSAYRFDWRARWTVSVPETAEEAAASTHLLSRLELDADLDGVPELEADVNHIP